MICWVDARVGVAGDMLLAALLDAGANLAVVHEAIAAASGGRASIRVERVLRRGIASSLLVVQADPDVHFDHLHELVACVDIAELPPLVAERARAVFTRLARAESSVHGEAADEVHLHEVGALDTVVDIVGCLTALADLGIEQVVASPIGVGAGMVRVAHGALSVPVPGVAALLAEVSAPSHAGPLEMEAATPTGVALLAELASQWGGQPPMRVSAQGIGAGNADPAAAANVTRVLFGEPVGVPGSAEPGWETSVVEMHCNVDDLDPRTWPQTIDALLDAGALDAWLTPITMKGGRPAVMLGVLAEEGNLGALTDVVFTHTTTLGVRFAPIAREVLQREWVSVDVDGCEVSVKVGRREGRVLTVQPEWRDVVAAAAALGRAPRAVADAARAAVSHIT